MKHRLDKVPNARQMRKLGFTSHREGYWNFCKRVGDNTTFNLTINKETGGYETLVMNELFGQPEYYGNMIPVYRAYTIAAIDVVLHELARGGVEVKFDHAEYGTEATDD